MLRPLFAESRPIDEVLASVRAESAGMGPTLGRYRIAVIVVVAAVVVLLLAVGVFSLTAG